MEEIILCDGKYRFWMDGTTLRCDRHGAPWRDFVGDKAVTALFQEARDLTEGLEGMKEGVAQRIADLESRVK